VVYCPNCGAENEADAAFCESCGAGLEGEAPPTSLLAAPNRGIHWPLFAAILVLAAFVGGGAAAIALVLSGNGGSNDNVAGGSGRERTTATQVVEATSSPEAEVASASVPEATSAPEETIAPEETPTEAPPTAEPPLGYPTAEEAIAGYVAPSEYAGDCSATTLEEDAGKMCSSFYGGGGSQLVYAVGPTFSEFGEWLLLEQQADGTWLVVDTGPVGADMEPPWPVASAPPEQYVAGYASPGEAVAAHIEGYGLPYAGDCASADPETDSGSYCSVLWEDRGDQVIYAAGPAFSEAEEWLLVVLQGEDGGWLVVDEAEFTSGVEDPQPPWP
jgi:hypothetical protein